MTATGSPSRLRFLAAIALLLLAAAALRLVGLTDTPPGMTHDEADHGLTAWSIVNGARGVYFPIGYGREPLYDYATALVMRGTGPTILAARLTSVYFSLLLIAAVYAWVTRAFGRPAALLTAAGLAAGFWPLMAARQALRSIALPALFSLAVLFFWRGLEMAGGGTGERGSKGGQSPLLPRSPAPLRPILRFIAAGLFLGLTFYTYIPARALWLAFPALALYCWLWGGLATRPLPAADSSGGLPTRSTATDSSGGLPTRPTAADSAGGLPTHAIWGTALTLIVAALVAAPLFLYLAANPGLEARVSELSAPLGGAAGGDFGPLLTNAAASLRLFTIEGDQTWRYNIPGMPFLPFPLSWLFYAGLLVAGWLAVDGLRNRVSSEKLGFYDAARPGAFLALVWLALGFAPVLVTGPGLATTQAIGILPVLYLFPALALWGGYRAVMGLMADRRQTTAGKRGSIGAGEYATRYPPLATFLAVLLFAWLAAATTRDYFGRWANSPEVRVQYETAMVTALRYLDEGGRGAAAVSTITPGQYHTPAVALLTLHNPDVRPRWFDGRQSLLLPGEPDSTIILPGFTPLPPALQPYLEPAALVDELPMRPDDLDRPIRVYSIDGPAAIAAALARMPTADRRRPAAKFGDRLEFLGYGLSASEVAAGGTVSLVTAWRLLGPLPGAALFAHVVGPDGAPIAQADALGAPGESWVRGDVLLQLHEIPIPPGALPGDYPLVVGAYTQPDGTRLQLADSGNDTLELTWIRIEAEKDS